MFSIFPVEKLSSPLTLYPKLNIASTKFEPIKPAAPVTKNLEPFGNLIFSYPNFTASSINNLYFLPHID